MSSQKGARSKLADVLADIKNSRVEDEYDYKGPTPAKRRPAVNYVALSGHSTRSTRSSNNNLPSKTNPSTPSSSAFVLKLFDRTVDLAQFSSDTPLYPICRAWVHGHRPGQSQAKNYEKTNGEVIENQETLGDLANDVYSLPSPKKENEDVDSRIPQSVRDFKIPENVEETLDKAIQSMDHLECLESNKQRWKRVRQDWKDARRIHESRYEASFAILKDMFMATQRGV